MHYNRWYKYGSTDDPSPSEVQRFWAKVADGPVPDVAGVGTPCRLWTASRSSDGYGLFNYTGGSLAHRYAWSAVHGTIAEGYEINHLCLVRHCVEVSHLELVTHKANIRYSADRGSYVKWRDNRCPKGHPWDGSFDPDGKRRCHPCSNAKTSTDYYNNLPLVFPCGHLRSETGYRNSAGQTHCGPCRYPKAWAKRRSVGPVGGTMA